MNDHDEEPRITYHGGMDLSDDDDFGLPKSAPRPEVPKAGFLTLQQREGYVYMALQHPDNYVEHAQSLGFELDDAMAKAKAMWKISDPVLVYCHCLKEGRKEQRWRIIFRTRE
jgi:hypothetical protein